MANIATENLFENQKIVYNWEAHQLKCRDQNNKHATTYPNNLSNNNTTAISDLQMIILYWP